MATEWTRTEVDSVVEIYFSMLSIELAGETYSKTEFRRSLEHRVPRSKGSIEYKLQNISAVLDELGAVWINGYKPARNVQQLLRERVTERFERAANLRHDMMRAVEAPALDDHLAVLGPVSESPTTEPPAAPTRDRTGRRLDFAALEAGNRSLGKAGEIAIVEYERRTLQAAGRPDLAAGVRHVSVEDGDGLGYDVQSFDPATESPTFVEVKTTRYSRELPFYVTRNEVEFSEEAGDSFRLARIYQFGRNIGHFRLSGALRNTIWLDPQSYIGGPVNRATTTEQPAG
ncbi:MAG: DUF3883 domain-containing protein [Propionibacteriaceae bacterium]